MELPANFINSRLWLEALSERATIDSEPAVYALVHAKPFGRLSGASSILYIGSTRQLGGISESCRLRIYNYPNGPHARELRRRAQCLIDEGLEVTLKWLCVSSKTEAIAQESGLLKQYLTEHGELPPFNGRI